MSRKVSASLSGKVCLVTGATRGIGKGIALQLGEAGATVYVTGRTLDPAPGAGVGGSLKETVAEIEARGGRAIGVQCDHKKDEQVRDLFERIKREQNGRLDLLVNNAYSAVRLITDTTGKKFWEYSPDAWDEVNNVGLRNHYYCSVFAVRMMLEQGSGLIVNVSSAGGLRYIFNVAYGVGKAALDRMAADMAVELKSRGIACVSLWPGAVQTEEIQALMAKPDMNSSMRRMFEQGESVEYSGKAVVALAAADQRVVLGKTGRVLLTGDLGDEFGFKDVTGRPVTSMRSLRFLMERSRVLSRVAWLVPRCVKVPRFVMALIGSKF